MANKLIYMDGQKAVDIWEGNEGWTILSGDDTKTETREYYKFIPTLYRAVQLRMNAISTMPFELLKGKTQVDYSGDWQNKVNFMPNPFALLELVEASLVVAGCAYLFREKSQVATKGLRYHLPTSVTPIIDPERGLEGFKRPVNNVEKRFKVEDYVYFWPPDPYVEIGPAYNFPAQAAANASGVLLNVDVFAASFFKRGAIKSMLLTVQGMPKEAERQKLSDWWRNVVGGVKNAFGAQVINADAITPVVIGEGMKELENVSLSADKREDVAVALGIPMSILFANAANYATSQQDDLNFLTKTVIPECSFIASVLNEQIFKKEGMLFRFMPETLDAMQEDEAARSVALQQMTAAGVPLLMAMDILGFELTDEQRAELEKAVLEKEARAEQMVQQLQGKPASDDEEDEPDEDDQEAKADLKRWERKSLKALARGDKALVSFVSDHITTADAQRINAGLETATTADDVRAVFRGTNGKPDAKSVAELTEALRSVALAMRDRERDD